MARLIRPLRQQWPQLNNHHCCRSSPSLHHLLTSPTSTLSCCRAAPQLVCFAATPISSHRSVHTRTRARGPRFANAPRSADVDEKEGESGGSDSESDGKKSRNEKKREARRAVRWGMELAAFAPPQIKRILRQLSFCKDIVAKVFVQLSQKFGPDVKEGKRRQYNYIGKLLRDVEPELMDALIHATKDGDWSRLQTVPGFKAEEANDKEIEDEFEEEEEVSEEHIEMSTRWFDGLITNDVDITKEVYAVRVVDFDRQELRKLVRKVHAVQERESDGDEESEKKAAAAMATAKKSLNRFLRILAKQMPTE
ncbi:unnamed protein product [Linum tenue]|uniref:Uncharacterized protein n=2 Tax=Linum tenue TaxID=586396 RepID=A0AAV0LMQ9_9ROSI|nr:unnamed protein product [Linum tenue]